MKERPILFQGAMVRAILSGTKTQTRRVVKPQPPEWVKVWNGSDGLEHFFFDREEDDEGGRHWPDYETGVPCPYGQPGDQLWVREAHCFCPRSPSMEKWSHTPEEARVIYATDDVRLTGPHGLWRPKMRPSIHMPRWASRIQLEITAVRVERLQQISEADAEAEGIVREVRDAGLGRGGRPGWRWAQNEYAGSAVHGYELLWEQINGPGSWDANPWVWVVDFRRIVREELARVAQGEKKCSD